MDKASKDNQPRNILFLLSINRILMGRGSKIGKMTPILFIIICAVFIIMSAYLLNSIEISSISEDIRLIGVVVYLVVFLEFFLSAGRYSAGTIIYPGHLFQFPLSSNFKMLFLFAEQIISIKSLVYFGFASTVIIYIFSVSVITAFIAILLFFLFFLLMEIWIALVFLVIGNAFQKFKVLYPILVIVFLLPVQLSMIGLIDSMSFASFCTSGVIGFVGTGIGYALNARWLNVGLISFQMLLLALAGIIIDMIILNKLEVSIYEE